MGTAATSVGVAPSERAELEWLLDSGILGRSVNLIKVLRYICEETAAGRADHIKEYSIAVEGLGRKPDFDPQSDTIVRVTVHTLRKRLQEIYETGEGASHPVRVLIPPGGYSVQFLHVAEPPHASSEVPVANSGPLPHPADPFGSSLPPTDSSAPPAPLPPSRFPWLWISAALLLVIGGIVFAVLRTHSPHAPTAAATPPLPVSINGSAHILLGEDRHSYTDHSGDVWSPQPVCKGGESIRSTGADVAGTEDPYLYDGGLRGFVRCTFQAPPGSYELHLYFAEPSNLEPAERVVNVLVNANFNQSVDVVDRAGADHAATTLTIPGINPEPDGTIHLDFTSEVSPVNAIEVLPAPSAQPLPLRIVAASSSYKDDQGQLWLSDRYFRGGRHAHAPDREHDPNLGLYASGRIGNFRYALPAPAGNKYRVILHFREGWLGQVNGTPGGVGSRIFDVSCNGQTVLHNFDILAEGHGEVVTKTIEHVVPTALGMINLQFEQVVNYPLVNAIEVVPE